MSSIVTYYESELYTKLKWLMLFRLLFTSLLLGSTIILQMGEAQSVLALPLVALYSLIASIFVLSFVYAVLLPVITRVKLFAYVQIGVDTIFVSLIIIVTGGFSSIFTFLYIMVIIYASIIIFQRASLVMAALCSIQYGVMIDLEYYGLLKPIGINPNLLAFNYDFSYILYKILIIMVACFAVAFLSGLLAEQNRKSAKELKALSAHVKRVDKMAAIGEMAAGLAHEIKNPLASLSSSIQMLSQDVIKDSDQDRLMHIIIREADRLSTLVTNFLFFARPPLGKAETLDFNTAIAETVDFFEKDSGVREFIEITRDFTPGLHVSMDPMHLNQIMWNLLVNAAEAIEGNGNIEVQTYAMKSRQVCVSVKDNGCGVPPDIVESIFDPFFTTKPKGTGLGLSIVHRIVESYDGRLDISSTPEKGSTFIMIVGRVDAPA